MLPENEISSIIDPNNSLEQPSLTLSKRKQLLDKIKAIKKTGYAVSMRERDLDTGGIAAPVFDDRGVIGSLDVIGPVDRMERNGIGRIGKQVQIIANQLTDELVSGNRHLSNELKRTAR
jgi:DNA-binding IclR family transcriptional regulator